MEKERMREIVELNIELGISRIPKPPEDSSGSQMNN
jgi:hypothetical protein